MRVKPTGREIAEALGISEGRVSQLRRDGMPADSVDAACAWYKRRVDPARSFGQRHRFGRKPTAAAAAAADPLEHLAVLSVRAERLLEAGRPLDPLEDELRDALASVPESEIFRVELPAEVWTFLCREVLAIAREYDAAPADAEPSDADPPVNLDLFWYQVAAGLVRPIPEGDSL